MHKPVLRPSNALPQTIQASAHLLWGREVRVSLDEVDSTVFHRQARYVTHSRFGKPAEAMPRNQPWPL